MFLLSEENNAQPQPSKRRLNIKSKKSALLLLIFIILVAGGSILGYKQYEKNKNPQVLAANEVKDIVAKVGKIIDLPNESPTVATVSDATKLRGQEFFAKAQNGDKVLIFPNARKAILYRPSTNKVVEVALYNPPVTSPTSSSAQVVTPTPGSSLLDLIKKSSANPSPVPTTGSLTSTPTQAPSPAPSL